jgi:hypothetical protein
MHLYPIDGAVRRVPSDASAWRTRDATVDGHRPNPFGSQAGRRAEGVGRNYWKAVHPFNLEGGYVNFMMDDEAEGRVKATYGANYSRLASVQAQYDPQNLFRVNQNIQPHA